MGGGIGRHRGSGRKLDIEPCGYCGHRADMAVAEWTGGPDGYTAYVECHGCEARGPTSPWVYETPEEAEDAALALWRRDAAALAELRERHG